MTFQQAKDKLKEVADGKYHSLYYDLSEFSSGHLDTECRLYIDQVGGVTGKTWAEAFTALHRKMNGAGVKEDEMPGDEIAATVEWGTQ